MELKLWTNRWNHFDSYQIERTTTGWRVKGIDPFWSDIEKTGASLFEGKAHQDGIHYPSDLPDFLGYLWEHAEKNGLSDDEIQGQLDLLSEWQKATELARPRGIWEGVMS